MAGGSSQATERIPASLKGKGSEGRKFRSIEKGALGTTSKTAFTYYFRHSFYMIHNRACVIRINTLIYH